jgi:hypothetical protein
MENPTELTILYGVTYNRPTMKIWRIWAKALGEKSGSTDKEADKIALIRTLIVLSYIITNCFIIAGVVRHW